SHSRARRTTNPARRCDQQHDRDRRGLPVSVHRKLGGDRIMKFFMFALLSLAMFVSFTQDGDKFVYADFEKAENGRAVTNAGGMVQIYTGNESTPVKFKGLANANPGAPELIVLKDAPQNHLASFEYNLVGPNQWANVTLEIQGRPLNNG